ncbi:MULTISPECIES: DivIVA domain-containing protein [unclassified Streptosporangium]|uniref:DivIVA domain-containing protein n=1 Tax=unclassified Streptosporangium TaxID=2632669 RepID=UPI002E29175B|nr:MULTISPECIES: DivIVA domain-containing protein [unclassified Streptosporangium]
MGYDTDQVDLLIRRIEGTLGRGTPEGEPVTADEIRGARFRTRLGGYHEIAVDFALEAFIVAIETRPAGTDGRPVVPARRAAPEEPEPGEPGEGWEDHAARVERAAFRPGRLGMGYNEDEVDAFLDRIVATLRGTTDTPLTPGDVREARFSTVMLRPGYAIGEVDEFLAEMAGVLETHPGR